MNQFRIKVVPYTLQFKRPAGTSRGVYLDHKVWYVIVYSVSTPSTNWGIGECAPLSDLSCDYDENYENNLKTFCNKIEQTQYLDIEALRNYPSILFGLETAFMHYKTNNFNLCENHFTKGERGIPINGLIWMGDYSYMLEQIQVKIDEGYRCIKLKIGAINFDEELQLLKYIRNRFSAQDLTLRVDANGAFKPKDALSKLQKLALFDLHSIEQPIQAGQWDTMAQLTKDSPLPIALDEELIGVNDMRKKLELLQKTGPQYIILKPTLHGGLNGVSEWIELAEKLNIGWWITSALESNIGLNAIAQWSGNFDRVYSMPQGLGTGGLYFNNIQMPLEIRGDCLWLDNEISYFSLSDLNIEF